MPNPLNETAFEEHIAEYLAGSPLYNQRTSADFDIARLVDRDMLEAFLKQQPIVWQKLSTAYAGREVDVVIDEYNKQINRGESILTLLHKGVTIRGAKVRFLQFKPVLDGPESANYQLYQQNRFSVVRQMKYSTAGDDKLDELDLCILINGIPLMTFELKNEGSGQNYGNGIYQYRYERNPENRMLRNCLVHFVMDNDYVFMTTRLAGKDTYFLPFNRDSKNPAIEGEYPGLYVAGDTTGRLAAGHNRELHQAIIRREDQQGDWTKGESGRCIFPTLPSVACSAQVAHTCSRRRSRT